jgi:SAM-dependent methyltransferase
MKFNCDYQNAENWQIRAENAVEILLANTSIILVNQKDGIKIADFGCGNERLKPLLMAKLGNEIDYYGYDLEPQLKSTYKINLEYEIPELKFDVIFCLGLLEYVTNLENLFANISQICNFAIVSYVTCDSGAYNTSDILNNKWQHHYSCQEIEMKFQTSQLTRKYFKLTDKGKTGLWLVQSNFNKK